MCYNCLFTLSVTFGFAVYCYLFYRIFERIYALNKELSDHVFLLHERIDHIIHNVIPNQPNKSKK